MKRRIVESYLKSLLPSAVLVAVGWVLAIPVLGNSYYLAIYLPVVMTVCVLLAWFGYLKRDHFVPPRQRREPAPVTDENDTGSPLARWDAAILPRSDTKPDTGNRPLVLLWIAVNLGIVATALYHAFGVGASFFGAA